ncbi:hypothetical protein [Brevundimonas sp.]|nr:hypothetical protein [Brevundimonas sp.]MDP1911835.1 hypothetical protein [Brevundimonas sp.]
MAHEHSRSTERPASTANGILILLIRLLGVLCADRQARPVINTGALYG